MRRSPLIARASRALTFVRYMPPGKLARRLELDVRRQLRDRVGILLPATRSKARPERALVPPQPLMAPRVEATPVRLDDGGWRFSFLGRTVDMPGRIDWTAPGPGAANQLWRMNLHYMEYLEAVDDAVWGLLVRAWIEDNPGRARGAWRDSWNSYALSLRAVVWMQELARRSGRLAPDIVALAEASIAEQFAFLERNLETDLGGNHLVKNIKALVWAGAYFHGGMAERWRALGVGLLSREIGKQILPDGMHDERSASYHAQVLIDLLECRHALGHDPLAGRLDSTLARMAQAVADLAHPDGGPILFNDAGLTMAYAPAACLDAVQRVLGGGHLRAPRAVFAYPEAGYFGLRLPDSYLVVDCGRIAPDDLPAHGHGDVLSLEWSVGGQRLIVDQGVYEYIAGPRRQQARSAASHSTLVIDGADQADFFGAFRCGRRPNVEVRTWSPGRDGFLLEGAHDGFAHLPGRPVHVRRVEAGPGRVIITDRIEGGGAHGARAGLLLHPQVEARVEGNSACLIRGAASVMVTASQPIVSEPAVWWPDMGVEQPTLRLTMLLPSGSRELLVEMSAGSAGG